MLLGLLVHFSQQCQYQFGEADLSLLHLLNSHTHTSLACCRWPWSCSTHLSVVLGKCVPCRVVACQTQGGEQWSAAAVECSH